MTTTTGVMSNEQVLLTDELRVKTKGVHNKTQRLVQLRLFSVLDYQIYRQILLGFYYVFKTFEEEYEKHLKTRGQDVHPWVLHAYAPELRRTELFEADLAYFYGDDWKEHVRPSKPAQEYMDHIRDISKHHPEKLVAFPATLYSGLFFGGQITRSKMVKSAHFFPSPPNKKLGGANDDGIAIFAFREQADGSGKDPTSHGNSSNNNNNNNVQGHKMDPNKLKNMLKARLNSIPGIDDASDKALKERQAIVEEAREIFVRNLEIITSAEGISRVWTRWVVRFVLYLAIATALYKIYKS
ncbi:heme oxygenase [Mortierella claussenii]|nr:heme oxygenase [Mortierella claussenii]